MPAEQKAEAEAHSATHDDLDSSGADGYDSSAQMQVHIQKCFWCDKEGEDLHSCKQCSQAVYCNTNCQRKHGKMHKRACKAAVTALTLQATRVRLAKTVRDKGPGAKVKGSKADKLCMICQAKPEDPVQVRAIFH